jgi:mono/diheme cytochrome c family protein
MKLSHQHPSSLLRTPSSLCASAILAIACFTTNAWSADNSPTPASPDEPVPAFTAAVMQDPSYIESGKQVWDGQCRHCHGNSAYPGKAPKLKPSSYQPEFVYDRVTNGFRKMPAWKAVFNEKQRVGVVSYIMSGDFAP